MTNRPHWEQCIDHKNDDVERFINDFFASPDRRCLLIAGAGFDPRAPSFSQILHDTLNGRLHVILIREDRPNPDVKLVQRADKNLEHIQSVLDQCKLISIDIFADDNAVVGGRKVITELRSEALDSYTDIAIDLSALSIGVSFPIIRFMYESAKELEIPLNVHLLVASNPALDHVITPISSDVVNTLHGFKGNAGLHGVTQPAKLWLPQLSIKRKEDLKKIYDLVNPDDTCPILPFPSRDPKSGDRLALEFIEELENTWEVDTRNLVYADEENPLDLYRTILRIDDERKPVFKGFGGSLLVLTPLGSKILAIGALMGALERNLPVYYIEALGYDVNWDEVDNLEIGDQVMRHIWLYGEVYPTDIVDN